MDFDKDAEMASRKLPVSERFRLAGKQKEEGNELFKAGKHDDAIRRWKKACDHLSRCEAAALSAEQIEESNAVLISCNNNMANCYLKAAATQEKDKGRNEAAPFYTKAMTCCDNVLDIADNVKGRFRRATCWERLGEVQKAMKDIKAGLVLEP